MQNQFFDLIKDYDSWRLYINGQVLNDGDELEVIINGLAYWDLVIKVTEELNGLKYDFYSLLSCYIKDDYKIDNYKARWTK